MLQCAITVWMLHHIVFLLHKTICSNAFLMGWIAVLLLLSSYYRFDKVKRWLICWGVHIALFFKDFVWWYFCTKSFYGLRNNLVWHKYSLKFVKSKTSYVKSYFWYPNNPSSILLLEFMLNIIEIPVSYGPSTKYVRICLAIFDTPLPNVGILTLSWLAPTF